MNAWEPVRLHMHERAARWWLLWVSGACGAAKLALVLFGRAEDLPYYLPWNS